MAASSLLLLVSVLLCVHQIISTCPPTAGIYLMYNGDCYPNGSFFKDVAITIPPLAQFPNPDYLQCVLPNSTLDGGEWSRTSTKGMATGPVGCSSTVPHDNLRCIENTSPANLTLYRPNDRGFDPHEDQMYKCCLPTNCSDPFTNIITAYIFISIQIVEFNVDLPSNITIIPQNLTFHCVTTGFGSYSISISYNTHEIIGATCPSGTYCSRHLLHSFNTTYDNTVTLTWDTETISNDDMSFSQLANGDQMYTCNVVYRVTRKSLLTILVPGFVPSPVMIVSKTPTTITVSWTSNSTDADGYVVNATSDTAGTVTQQVEGGDVNITTLRGLKGGTPYNITIRAYQDLLGLASNVTTVQTYLLAIDWTLVSSISDLQYTQYRIDCLTDINNTYWIVNGIYTDMFTNNTNEKGEIYNNSFIINSNPLGMSINVTCVTYTEENYYYDSVILQAPSSPPINVRGYILNETSIKVNWTLSSHANGYVIVFTDLMNKVVSSVTETKFMTKTLPLSTYNISVYSYIDVPSVESVSISFTFNVPSPITNLTVTDVSTTTITVNWISPNCHEGNYVTQYNISYTPSCPDLPSLNKIVHVPPYTTMSSYTLMELYSGMKYTITVRAGNVLGESDPMNINNGTLPTVPRSSPNSVSITYINQTSINITWDDINCTNSNSRILEYIVMISNDTITYNITSTERYIIVNDLSIGIYKISVGGVNSIGSGPFSEKIEVKIGVASTSTTTESADRTSSVSSLSTGIITSIDTSIGTYTGLGVVVGLLLTTQLTSVIIILFLIFCIIRIRLKKSRTIRQDKSSNDDIMMQPREIYDNKECKSIDEVEYDECNIPSGTVYEIVY